MLVAATVIIENAEIAKYIKAAEKKKGVCHVPPAAQFSVSNGRMRFDFLVCSDKMGGKQTGAGAETCTNCLRDKE